MQFDHHPRDLSGRGRGVPIKVFDQCVGDFILSLSSAQVPEARQTWHECPWAGFWWRWDQFFSRRRASVESKWIQKRDTLLL